MIMGFVLFVVVAVVMSLFGRKIAHLLMKITGPEKLNIWDFILYILLFFGFIIGFLFFWFQVVEPNRF